MDERSAKLGEHIHERLIKEFLPLPCVDDVMGRGCYHSFAIALNKTTGHPVSPEVQSKIGDETLSKFLDAGVMSRIEWGRRVAIIPPLIIGEAELDKALDIMRDVIKQVKPV
jgi:adenosylmethionine-8-amino-7-oxononanoate aminotransferase